jgi:UDP-N-acetylglucosamine 2-epimerase (non-hydrolysing)
MLRQVLDFFQIEPDYDFDLMRENQDLPNLTARILTSLAPVLEQEQPDFVVVQGDTATSFAAALAAYYARVPVAHVEAGLRTGDLYAPFPEEALRQMTGRLAAVHFAPTSRNKQALLAEGVPASRILVTGNTVIDAVLWAKEKLQHRGLAPLRSSLGSEQMERLESAARIVMITAHRRESFGEGFRNICAALRRLAKSEPETLFVYPVHPNPNVAGVAREYLSKCRNMILTKPLDYPAFVCLMNASYFILTDSGGVQEEAPSLGKPVLVLRDVTEREEAVESGQVRLVGTDAERIVATARELLASEAVYQRMASGLNPYGDGRAAERIANWIAASQPCAAIRAAC